MPLHSCALTSCMSARGAYKEDGECRLTRVAKEREPLGEQPLPYTVCAGCKPMSDEFDIAGWLGGEVEDPRTKAPHVLPEKLKTILQDGFNDDVFTEDDVTALDTCHVHLIPRESAVDTQRTVTRARHGVRGGLMHVMRRRVGCAPNGEMSFGAVEVMDFDDFVSGGAVGVLGVVRDHW